jgi:hypothetical protein
MTIMYNTKDNGKKGYFRKEKKKRNKNKKKQSKISNFHEFSIVFKYFFGSR